VKLVADANVLISAVLGGRAALVLNHPTVEDVVTTSATFGEVQEYATVLARSRRLSPDALLLAAIALPVSIVEREVYAHNLVRANKLIGNRDPDDIDVLALTLQLRIPLWSNDNDFEQCGVEWYTTAELPKHLGISGRK